MKTLLFCTTYCATHESWNNRVLKWINGAKKSGVHFDQILIVDDGSPVLPTSFDHAFIQNDTTVCPESEVVLLQFTPNLGRKAGLDHAGWDRSFHKAFEYAIKHGFNKVIHLESDAFILSPRLANEVNSIKEGWRAWWCPRWQFPEAAFQVAAGLGVVRAYEDARKDNEYWRGRFVEREYQFTEVDQRFNGDRYGEYLNGIPSNADYACQVLEHWMIP